MNEGKKTPPTSPCCGLPCCCMCGWTTMHTIYTFVTFFVFSFLTPHIPIFLSVLITGRDCVNSSSPTFIWGLTSQQNAVFTRLLPIKRPHFHPTQISLILLTFSVITQFAQLESVLTTSPSTDCLILINIAGENTSYAEIRGAQRRAAQMVQSRSASSGTHKNLILYLFTINPHSRVISHSYKSFFPPQLHCLNCFLEQT